MACECKWDQSISKSKVGANLHRYLCRAIDGPRMSASGTKRSLGKLPSNVRL